MESLHLRPMAGDCITSLQALATGTTRGAARQMALPVHDMLWETQLPEGGSQTSNPLLKLVSLTRITGSRHNGHMHITSHEVDDVANHLAVVLHVSAVSIKCTISIKGDQL